MWRQSLRQIFYMVGAFGKYNRVSSVFNRIDDILYYKFVTDLIVLNVTVNISYHPFVFILVHGPLKLCETRDHIMLKGPRHRLGFRVHAIPDFAAMHVNDRMVAVLPRWRGRQAVDIFCVYGFQNLLEAESRHMMAFVHDDHTVFLDKTVDLFFAC